MAQHGYLHDTYDRDDFAAGDDSGGRWNQRDEERAWRGPERDWDERGSDRESMFGWRDDDRSPSRNRDRGFVERGGDELSSWFGGEDSDASRSRDYERGGSRYGHRRDEGRRTFSAHPDDHYLSWRQKQIEALDRDYQEYCRECEQRFHQDFDSWRSKRRNQGTTGPEDSQQGRSSTDVMELDNPAAQGGTIPGATTSPVGDATLGTNNPANTRRGRR